MTKYSCVDYQWLPYLKIKEFDQATWILVFFHNSSENTFWSRDETARFSLEKKRFSILGSLDESFAYNNKYEFLLQYPGKNGFNRWKQDLNPADDINSDGRNNRYVKGYEPVNISWCAEKGYDHFGGLARSDSGHSYIDGHISNISYYYYSIGAFSPFIGGIAGFTNQDYFESVELWCRVRNIKFVRNKDRFKATYQIILRTLVISSYFFE